MTIDDPFCTNVPTILTIDDPICTIVDTFLTIDGSFCTIVHAFLTNDDTFLNIVPLPGPTLIHFGEAIAKIVEMMEQNDGTFLHFGGTFYPRKGNQE